MATTDINVTLDPVFTRLLQTQRMIQNNHMDRDMSTMDPEQLRSYIREQALALVGEVCEALGETQWKPWAKLIEDKPIVDRPRFIGEMADVFIFFMNLMIAGEVTTHDLAKAVEAKQVININRQISGYDGKSTKCPGCKRAYDDPAVKCMPVVMGNPSDPEDGSPQPAWCDEDQVWM